MMTETAPALHTDGSTMTTMRAVKPNKQRKVPEGFLPWNDLKGPYACSYKKFIEENVPAVKNMQGNKENVYITTASVVHSDQPDNPVSFIYTSFDVNAKLKGTTSPHGSARLKTFSWYTYTFVIVFVEDSDEFHVYTPISKKDLRLHYDTAQGAQFCCNVKETHRLHLVEGDRGDCASYKWSVAQQSDYEDLYLRLDRNKGTMKFLPATTPPTQYTFTYPPILDWPEGFQPLSEFQPDTRKRNVDVVQELGIGYQFINLAKIEVFTAQDTSVPVQVDEATGKLMTANPGDPASVFVFVRMLDGSDVVLQLERENNVYLQKGQSGDSSVEFKSLKEWKQGGADAARIKYDISPHNGAIAYKMKEQAASLYLALNGNTITYGEEGAVFTFHHGTDATCAIL